MTWNDGKRIIKGNKVITRSVQLLTDQEKRERHLKKINITNITEIYRLMTEEKMSISQIRTFLRLSKYAYYGRLQLLKMLNISEQNISMIKLIDVRTDFSDYYHKTIGISYKGDFYFSAIYSRYNYVPIQKRKTLVEYKTENNL